MHGRRGFTLTELLVVLSIVGLLIAILLPAMGGMRQMAWRTQCGANLRQIGIALANYTARERVLPYAAVISRDRRGLALFAVSWDDLLNRDLGGDLTEAELIADLSPRSRPVLICPADRLPRIYSVPFHPLSYAIVEGPLLADPPPGARYFLGTAGQSWLRDLGPNSSLPVPISVRPTDVPRPAETFVVLDYAVDFSAQGMSGSRASQVWSRWSVITNGRLQVEPIPPPHRGRFNALYHDGHVEAVLEADTLGNGTPSSPRGPWTIDPKD